MKLLMGALLCCAVVLCSAQDKSSYRWYFGSKLGLDFNSSPPVQLSDGQSTHAEGTASICDAQTGNLLFYTDGMTVWNKNQVVIASGLPTTNSSTQAALIIRQPGSTTLFHMFTTPSYGGAKARHFIVDMSAAGGAGAITSSNLGLTPTSVSEKVTATRACNGTDYWIVFERTGAGNHGYYTYRLGAFGLDPTPVSSNIGTDITVGDENIGAMCISPDGRHVVSAHYGADCLLMDFDNSTGLLSNIQKLSANVNKHCYGVTFSPSSRYLYVNSGWSGPADSIVRFDMTASPIASSRVTIGRAPCALGYMELAPDGKIYVARFNTSSIATISNPDAANPLYTDLAITFPANLQWGLPNFPQDLFIPNYAGKDTTICPGTPTRLGIPAVAGMSYSWTPSVGLDSPNVAQPLATVQFATSYTVTVSDSRGCTVQRAVALNVHPKPFFTLNSDASNNTSCAGTDVELSTTATNFKSVQWTPGNLNGNIVHVRPTQTTTYRASVLDANGCTWVDSIVITVRPLPNVRVSAAQGLTNDTAYVCQGQSAQLSSSSVFPSYEWSTGETTASISVSSSSTVWLRVRDANGCFNADTIAVFVRPLPQVNAGANSSVCSGTSYTMTAKAATAQGVRWTRLSPGAPLLSDSTLLNTTLTGNTAGSYDYELFITDQFGCSNRDTVQLTILPLPVASFSPFRADTSLCPCTTINLVATPGFVYQWYKDSVAIGGQTTQSLLVTSSGSYSVRVVDANTCSAMSPVSKISYIPVSAKVSVSSNDVVDGQNVGLAVSATGNNLAQCANDSATVYLRMNRFPLAPTKADEAGVLQGTDQRVLALRVLFNNGTMNRSLSYIGTLGEIDTTVISIDSVHWDRCAIPTTTVSDTFHLQGVCRASGAPRLFFMSVNAMSVLPNPARDKATVRVDLNTDVTDCVVELHDALGRVLRTIRPGNLTKGMHDIEMSVDGLCGGLYALQLQTGTGMSTMLLEVQP